MPEFFIGEPPKMPFKRRTSGMVKDIQSSDENASDKKAAEADYDAEMADFVRDSREYLRMTVDVEGIKDKFERKLNDWHEKVAKTYTVIYQSVNEKVRATCSDAFLTRDPKQIMEALDIQYGAADESDLADIYDRLGDMKLLPTQSMSQFCECLNDLFTTLESRKETVTDAAKLAYLRRGIKTSTRATEFEDIIRIARHSKFGYLDTRESIIKEEASNYKSPKKFTKTDEHQAVHLATTAKARGNIKPRCNYCNKGGHTESEWWSKSKDNTQTTTHRPKGREETLAHIRLDKLP